MPKNYAEKKRTQRANGIMPWTIRKKMLPKNWCQIISESLNSKGFTTDADKISDARMGKIKNLDLQTAVWREIRKLESKEKIRREKLQELQKQ